MKLGWNKYMNKKNGSEKLASRHHPYIFHEDVVTDFKKDVGMSILASCHSHYSCSCTFILTSFLHFTI